MSKGRLILLVIVLAVLLFSFIVFGRIFGIIILGLLIAAAFGLKQPLQRFWKFLG